MRIFRKVILLIVLLASTTACGGDPTPTPKLATFPPSPPELAASTPEPPVLTIPLIEGDGIREPPFVENYVTNDANGLNEANGIYATQVTADVEQLDTPRARQFVEGLQGSLLWCPVRRLQYSC